MPELHLEILPDAQKIGWDQLQKQADFLINNKFYLAGGTALALQIGHRQSVDFDFFSQQKNTGQPTFDWLQTMSDFVLRDMDANTVHGQLGQVKASFIGGYKYPLVEALVPVDNLSCAVKSS